MKLLRQAKIAALCRAHNIDHTLVSRPEQIIPTFDKLIEKKGVHVMECITGAEESMEQRHALWDFKINNRLMNIRVRGISYHFEIHQQNTNPSLSCIAPWIYGKRRKFSTPDSRA
ncbi:hypothetical protein [Rhodohalobacter sp.]|uniref:hypothetical protein n=1 Tax=Rhodohalobacter sp. TaxID=1974210 RepID=UPI002ACEE992|nr:hypothetical protein [Rhodohalobacter sp.]MDZ7756074.1 hypothetical protein [Rhodohalobacter sp.]